MFSGKRKLYTIRRVKKYSVVNSNVESIQDAAENGLYSVVQHLIRVNLCAACINYALCYAARDGHIFIVQYLVEHGANIHASRDYAARWSAGNGHYLVLKYLIEHNADMCAWDNFVPRYASSGGYPLVIEYLKSVYELIF